MLDVEEFASARAFEINAMENAILNSTQFIGNKRVFQRIPRHMRRRPASHNPKRLPRIIRQRAIDQMAQDPPLKPNRKKKYPRKAKRQSALKIWLEFGRRQGI